MKNYLVKINIKIDEFKLVWVKFNDRLYKYRIQIILVLTSSCLIINTINIVTISYIIILIIVIIIYLKEKTFNLKNNGLWYYFPENVKNSFYKRSLFDILCDLWFFPKVSLYFRVIVLPFILKPVPEEAYKIFDILPENEKKFFLRKGFLFSLPEFIQNLMLPTDFNVHKKIENNIYNLSIGKLNNNYIKSIEDKDKNSFFNIDFVFNNINKKKLDKQNSKILVSSQMLKNFNHLPGKIDEKWDRLAEYQTKKKNQKDKTKKKINKIEKIGPIKIILKILELKKSRFFKKITKKQLILISLFNIFLLLFKLKYFKNFRNLYKTLLIKLLFTFGFSFTVITFIGLYMKYDIDNKKNIEENKKE